MESNSLERAYRLLWGAATVTVGILAGFMTSHSVMLGRFFTWYVESGNMDLLRATYSAFRLESSPQLLYNLFLYLGLVAGLAWAVLAFIVKRHRVAALLAGLSTLWVGVAFRASGFNELEEAVMTATADPATALRFVQLNVPLHASFALVYVASLVALLVVGARPGRPAAAAGRAS
jgi:hypothetical protein